MDEADGQFSPIALLVHDDEMVGTNGTGASIKGHTASRQGPSSATICTVRWSQTVSDGHANTICQSADTEVQLEQMTFAAHKNLHEAAYL